MYPFCVRKNSQPEKRQFCDEMLLHLECKALINTSEARAYGTTLFTAIAANCFYIKYLGFRTMVCLIFLQLPEVVSRDIRGN